MFFDIKYPKTKSLAVHTELEPWRQEVVESPVNEQTEE